MVGIVVGFVLVDVGVSMVNDVVGGEEDNVGNEALI